MDILAEISRLEVDYDRQGEVLIVDIQSKDMNPVQVKNFIDNLPEEIKKREVKKVVLNLLNLENGSGIKSDCAAGLIFITAINTLRFTMDIKIVMVSKESEKWTEFETFSTEKEAIDYLKR